MGRVRSRINVNVLAGVGASSRALATKVIIRIYGPISLFIASGLYSLLSRAYLICGMQRLNGCSAKFAI